MMDSEGITVEDEVWSGVEAVITHGVRLGPGAVVDPGAVVTEEVPRRTVVTGVPTPIEKTISGDELPSDILICS
jgi:acetyltransferase-like isoleucine patch superfamily enzyme